jgi:hypothetical protein
MFRKIALTVFAVTLASSAMAMSGSMKRFFNDDGSMKAEADVTTLYAGMSADDQSKMKDECKANKGSVGISEAQQAFCNWLARTR